MISEQAMKISHVDLLRILAGLVLCTDIAMSNVAPDVSNVEAIQRTFPSELVQISYDVYDGDGDEMTVSLLISSDSGSTWTVPVVTVTGDVGSGIQSGVNYEIIWNAGVDYAGHTGTQYEAKVVANDNHYEPGDMVLAPSCSFQMGATYQSFAQPLHAVNVPASFIDAFEVTNTQFKAFCDATDRPYPPSPEFYPNYFTNPLYANYPVVYVSWYDARDYASWAGKRLPTEAEWELAAKGFLDNRQWPWGDEWIAGNANIANNPADSFAYSSPVGYYISGVSPAGCYDMVGNVWEWCEDDWHWNYDGAPTDGSAWIDDPRGPYRITRGGSWMLSDPEAARCASRYWNFWPTDRNQNTGFRCASDL